mmetsp:Transcript_1945/g.4401  ORF Transcript_1945/g.4401 Transcript_1945/m.4401 type:complete len:591 (-) Transcript_1945:792-2564(-)|eukprot:CAMPEP_0171495894 /NCGR_PEP_ID=MMETSP0958-20121227/6391_1 /TAXON_ID=87120 /ORGANISM="Aurantiochytrium limacinum, Strain ATCCMYA-1381" /LENGTH=590 /DNA_ID=CAMNT_0012029919 /DNA_START=1065 /DNA_END=2837 /DNA_ORIENTATION=-
MDPPTAARDEEGWVSVGDRHGTTTNPSSTASTTENDANPSHAVELDEEEVMLPAGMDESAGSVVLEKNLYRADQRHDDEDDEDDDEEEDEEEDEEGGQYNEDDEGCSDTEDPNSLGNDGTFHGDSTIATSKDHEFASNNGNCNHEDPKSDSKMCIKASAGKQYIVQVVGEAPFSRKELIELQEKIIQGLNNSEQIVKCSTLASRFFLHGVQGDQPRAAVDFVDLENASSTTTSAAPDGRRYDLAIFVHLTQGQTPNTIPTKQVLSSQVRSARKWLTMPVVQLAPNSSTNSPSGSANIVTDSSVVDSEDSGLPTMSEGGAGDTLSAQYRLPHLNISCSTVSDVGNAISRALFMALEMDLATTTQNQSPCAEKLKPQASLFGSIADCWMMLVATILNLMIAFVNPPVALFGTAVLFATQKGIGSIQRQQQLAFTVLAMQLAVLLFVQTQAQPSIQVAPLSFPSIPQASSTCTGKDNTEALAMALQQQRLELNNLMRFSLSGQRPHLSEEQRAQLPHSILAWERQWNIHDMEMGNRAKALSDEVLHLRHYLVESLHRCGWWCEDTKTHMGEHQGWWFQEDLEHPHILYLKPSE